MSGHIFFKNRYFGFDDAVYSSARLLEILTHEPQEALASCCRTCRRRTPRPSCAWTPRRRRSSSWCARCTETLRAAGHQIIDVDGVRVTFPDGWGLIRASNTQPILVLRFEANTPERLKEIQHLIEGTVEKMKREVGG